MVERPCGLRPRDVGGRRERRPIGRPDVPRPPLPGCPRPSFAIGTSASRSPKVTGSFRGDLAAGDPARPEYAILTMEPNADLAPYHDRQMAVLTRRQRMAWPTDCSAKTKFCGRSRQGLSRSRDIQPLRFRRYWTGLRPIRLVLARRHLGQKLVAGNAAEPVSPVTCCPCAPFRAPLDGASASPNPFRYRQSFRCFPSGSQPRHAANSVPFAACQSHLYVN